MRVLHVIPSVSAVHGGPSRALKLMTEGLAARGIQVDVATTDDDGAGHLAVALGKPISENGVRTWFFRRQTRFYKVSLPLTRWLARNVASYDLVHIHALFSYSSTAAAWLAKRQRVPYVLRPLGTLNRWGMEKHHARYKRLSLALVERRIIEGATLVHYTSTQEQREAEELGIHPPSAVIPVGIPLLQEGPYRSEAWVAARAPRLRDRTRILFLSRLDPKKGVELLFGALARVKRAGRNVALVIAGSGDPKYVETLTALASQLNVNGEAVWTGQVGGDEKEALLRAADLFVLPSHSENFGIAAVEAMAAGLPVIVTDRVGIHPEIAASGAGIVIQPDEESLAFAIEELIDNPAARREMGARGWALARDKFSVEAMTNGLMEAYGRVMTDASRAWVCK